MAAQSNQDVEDYNLMQPCSTSGHTINAHWIPTESCDFWRSATAPLLDLASRQEVTFFKDSPTNIDVTFRKRKRNTLKRCRLCMWETRK